MNVARELTPPSGDPVGRQPSGDPATLRLSGDPAARPVASLFDGVVGQPAAVAAMRSAARRPVHAYLFVGPAGAGARASVRPFAAALLCPDGGCGVCRDCRLAIGGSHPDLVMIERTGATVAVEDARRLAELAQRKPFEADRQVLVMEDVHLAIRSAPALLKTVEEPPVATVFVLLAEEVPYELATVASRCVKIPFPPLPSADVVRWLIEDGIEPRHAEELAEAAGGDLERARLLAEDAEHAARLDLWRSVVSLLDGHGATAGALARQLLEAVDAGLGPIRQHHAREIEELAARAEALGERGVPGRKELIERQRRQERRWRTDEIRAGLGALSRAYRNRLVATLPGADAPHAAAGSGGSSSVAPRSGGSGSGGSSSGGSSSGGSGRELEASAAASAIDMVNEAATALRRNPDELLLLESLLVRLGQISG